jgi:preprotein translocase subunit SecE
MQLTLLNRIWQRIKQFFREIRAEVKKVTWPTREEVKVLTLVVVLFVFIFTAFIGIVDLILARVFALIAK